MNQQRESLTASISPAATLNFLFCKLGIARLD